MTLYFVMQWEVNVEEFTQPADAMRYAQKLTDETGVTHTVLVSE
jgi:hypothetical protein